MASRPCAIGVKGGAEGLVVLDTYPALAEAVRRRVDSV